MRRFFKLYQESLLLKLIVFFLFAVLIVFLFSDFVLDTFVQNTVLWYKIQLYRWFLIPLLLTLFLYIVLQKPFKYFHKAIENYENVNKNYRFVVDSLIDDYFFYRHEPDKPFKYLSSSVTNVLGYPKSDFFTIYKNIGALSLYQDIFERHKFYQTEKLPAPPFEVTVIDNKGNRCYLEIKEIPIFNDHEEIIAIEGIAKNITKYKLVEIELNEREKKYQTIFESTSDGILVLKDNKFIDCNNRMLEIFDCSLEELIMHTPFHYRFSPPVQPNGKSSRDFAKEKITAALKGIPQYYEWTHLRNGKNPFPAEISLTKFTFEGEDFVLAVVRDISTRKTIINTLKEKEESFKILYENIPLGILHLDSHFTPINTNPAFQKIIKVKPGSNINFITDQLSPYLNQLADESQQCQLEIIHPETKAKIILSIYCVKFQKDESYEYIVLFEDISEKKQLISAYYKQESFFKEILENSRQILYKLNVETGNYEYISNAIYHVLGYTPEEFYQMSADDIKSLIHPEDIVKADSIVAKMLKNISDKENDFTVEYRFRKKNGEYKWLHDKYQIISNESGVYVVGNIMDMTPLKEAEELIKRFRIEFGDIE